MCLSTKQTEQKKMKSPFKKAMNEKGKKQLELAWYNVNFIPPNILTSLAMAVTDQSWCWNDDDFLEKTTVEEVIT